MQKTYRIQAPAKINLTLDIVGKRADGYHELLTIMQGVTLFDDIAVKINNSGVISCKTNLPYLKQSAKNTAAVAAAKFFETTGLKNPGIEIHIRKNIPVCAGLGGGSSDAAAVLLLLNRIFSAGLDQQALMRIGEAVGADVPFCVYRKTALCAGIGEKITPLPNLHLPYIVLATPNIVVPTASIFQALQLSEIRRHPDTETAVAAVKSGDAEALCGAMYNVLEEVTAKQHAEIGIYEEILRAHGAAGVMMSGSGPSVFGIFREKAPAEKARRALLHKTRHAYRVQTVSNNTGAL